jgi:hypothetical protein
VSLPAVLRAGGDPGGICLGDDDYFFEPAVSADRFSIHAGDFLDIALAAPLA